MLSTSALNPMTVFTKSANLNEVGLFLTVFSLRFVREFSAHGSPHLKLLNDFCFGFQFSATYAPP